MSSTFARLLPREFGEASRHAFDVVLGVDDAVAERGRAVACEHRLAYPPTLEHDRRVRSDVAGRRRRVDDAADVRRPPDLLKSAAFLQPRTDGDVVDRRSTAADLEGGLEDSPVCLRVKVRGVQEVVEPRERARVE